MSDNLVSTEVSRQGVPIALRVLVPGDWLRLDLPDEATDFSNPALFHPLAGWAAPYAGVMFIIAARPGYESGTLTEWATFLATEQGYEVRSQMPVKSGPPAPDGPQRWSVLCSAVQPSDAGPMELRILLLEDGGTLVTVMAMCPQPVWSSLGAMLEKMVTTAEVLSPAGPTALIGPGFPATLPAPAGASSRPTVSPTADPVPAPEPAPASASPQGESSPPDSDTTPAGPSESAPFARFALADSPETLDPDHQINAFFRDNGRGFVPRILQFDPAAKCAVLGCGALSAMVTIPLGWHIIDDGRRVLIFDPANTTQINLVIRSRDGLSVDQIMDAIESDVANTYPGAKVARGDADGTPFILFRDMNVDGETLQQVHYLAPTPDAGFCFHLRLTTPLETLSSYGDLFTLVLQHTRFAGQ